jgi:ribose 5-phosphate isomerase A
MSQDHLKRQAAEYAVQFVESGMIVGLGSGSTALLAVHEIGRRIQQGILTGIVGIPTSNVIEREARQAGIPLTTLEAHPHIDLTIDGADEVNPDLDLIKGGGGALLREKIVAQSSAREIIIVDQTKLSDKLGAKWAVPVEVAEFGWGAQRLFLEALGARTKLRQTDGSAFRTDQGNVIIDCTFGAIEHPADLAEQLKLRTGIIEHGLFIQLVTDVIIAHSGGIEHRQR